MADEALTAGAVARRLGVAVTTLRTWHQRYGLGPSQHLPGHHRRYTAADLARLEVMRRLTAQGVPPAEAARWAVRTGGEATPDSADPTARSTAVRGDRATGSGDAGRPGASSDAAPVPGTGRDGGGHTIPVGRAGPGARGLARAAMRLDAAAIRDLLHFSVDRAGVIGTWHDMIVPVLIGIGERHAATRRLVEVEHLTSRTISEVLGGVPRPGGSPRVLLACADEEQHSLPLEALAAALAEAGVGCRLLGARVPPSALADAIRRTGPAAVAVWSQLPETANVAHLAALLDGQNRPLLVLAAGPGWHHVALPAGVVAPVDLGDAVRLIRQAA